MKNKLINKEYRLCMFSAKISSIRMIHTCHFTVCKNLESNALRRDIRANVIWKNNSNKMCILYIQGVFGIELEYISGISVFELGWHDQVKNVVKLGNG